MKSTLTLLFGLLLFSTLHAQVPSYVPTDGLVGWWPFNGNANDESGNGNDGVVNGATLTEDRFGSPNSCYNFNGTNQNIQITNSGSLTMSELTISVWILPLGNNGCIISKNNPNNATEKGFRLSHQDIFQVQRGLSTQYGVGNCSNTSEAGFYGSSGLIPNGVWSHITSTVTSSGLVHHYLNGVMIESNQSVPLIMCDNSTSTTRIGSYWTEDPDWFNGKIDNLAIYNRALIPAEVQELYTGQPVTPPVTCTPLPSNLQTGLVGYWPFCGNANDESGNGNDGVVNGATLTEDRFGNANAAYGFDGVDDIITVPDNSSLDFPGGAFSISAWVKLNVLDYETGFIDHLDNGGPSIFARYEIRILSNNKIRFVLKDMDSNFSYIDSDSLITNTNNWYHVVGTFNSSSQSIKLFINGVDQVGQVTLEGTGPSITPPGVLQFGRYGDASFANSLIDDIAIWNRALTPEEVQELYTGITPNPEPCVALPANLQTGLVGYWPFCGNANDESGNGNDGVVNGATLAEDRFGNAASAFSFDGVDYISGSAVNFPSGNSSRSISLWFQSDSILNEDPSILGTQLFGYGGGSCGTSFIGYFGAPYTFDVQGHCGNSVFSESIPSNINGPWHNLVLNYQSDNLEFYLDGVLMGTQPVSFNTSVNALSKFFWGIEVYPNGTEPYLNDISIWPSFQGNLDDIAIWNRALTPAEVQELYTLDACTFTVYDTLTVENIINVYDTLTIENIVDIYDTTYINVEVYDTLTVENIINVYDTLTIENIVEVYDTLTIENVIDVFDTTTVVETVVVFDTLTVENVIDVFDTTTVVETVVVFDTLTVENVIDVFDTTTVVETVVVFDTLTVENVIDVYDTTYVTVTDTLIIDIPSGVGGNILNTLLLYPNPTSDQLTISYGNFAAMAGYSLSIFDNGGSTVHETSITQAQETLDITQWSAGVYQVVVYNAGGVPVETRQIVIQ